MSFKREQLDQDKDDDEFFKDAESTPHAVEGVGQMVYWRDCSFIGILKTGENKPVYEIKHSKGQGIVEAGTSLLIGGIGGKVKEG